MDLPGENVEVSTDLQASLRDQLVYTDRYGQAVPIKLCPNARIEGNMEPVYLAQAVQKQGHRLLSTGPSHHFC